MTIQRKEYNKMTYLSTLDLPTTSGKESLYASVIPVMAFVAPGPLVTTTTPVLPETRAYPSAACVAPCS